MNILQALILSAVEGISEFLPISSTGHMILAADLLKIAQTGFVKDFEIIIQLGAILAIVVLYWNSLFKSIEVWKRIIVAFIPTGIIGLLLFKVVKNYLLGNLYITLVSLLIGGIILIILELIYKEKEHHIDDIAKMTLPKAFVIGLFQSIAIIPGVSRSAATIVGALFLGTKRKAAAEFSFILAVPTMLAATGLDLIKTNFSYSPNEWLMLAVGFFGAFIVALISVKLFLKYVQRNNFIIFGAYRVIAAVLFFLIVIK
ncbi:MAG TPA: undecaprenyl-diphosphate phosphatase [Patescibacteria group bacterium]|jgi:undecaprenyl-diphosphatase|nr:undecaprenyl-diphosphate phosphatase [Patescibacteria group bacterium]